MAGQHTGTPQDPIPIYLYKKVGDKIYRCGGGGGSGSGDIQYVQTPTILEPTDNGSASVLLKVVVTAYSNVFDNDAWADRCFQISKQIDFAADPSITKEYHELTNTLTLSADDRLEANTVYYLRVRDTSQSGLISEWSPVITFTTGDAITILAPTITALGYNNSTTDFVSGLTLQCSAFTVDQEQTDEHVSTSWWIDVVDSHARSAHVWESLKDTVNKLSIVVPEGTLSPDTTYRITCQHHGAEYGDGALGTKEIRTSSDFGTVNVPTLSVEGAPNDVYETPTLTAGTFSNTRDEDTHELTDWEILPQAGGAAVWQSLNDATNKTTIKVPKGKLAVSTAYTARVRYKGLRYGWSDWQSVQFNTVAAFSSINTPTLTVGGAPNSVLETPTLTLSAFGGDNATHKNTHFKVLKNDDNSEVWSTSVAAPAVSARVPAKTLQTATTYKFQGWYEAVEGVNSAVAEVVATTKSDFIAIGEIGAPDSSTFGVGIASDEEVEAFIPGMVKHPDFYSETKAGYGVWSTESKTTETDDGHNYLATCYLKYVPKFYWHPLFKGNGGPENGLSDEEIEALVPYVSVTKEQMIAVRDKYPYSGLVFASSSAFANEQEANDHGFILPAAFIDGGKEKNGFFMSPTFTAYYDASSHEKMLSMGIVYGGRPKHLYEFLRLDGSKKFCPGQQGNMSDAIIIPRQHHERLFCPTVYTAAAIGLIVLCTSQYSFSTQMCAWFDPNNNTNQPKGINQANIRDADDPSVCLEEQITTTKGPLFPTTEEGYRKTTHNGRINGITHINGWGFEPQFGFFWGQSGTYQMFDCTKSSLEKISLQDILRYEFAKVDVDYPLYPANRSWSEQNSTPLYTAISGVDRLKNCVYSHSEGPVSSNFGKDLIGINTPQVWWGNGTTYGEGSGVFFRVGGSGWGDNSQHFTGFHVIGYSALNSDGTIGASDYIVDDGSVFEGATVIRDPELEDSWWNESLTDGQPQQTVWNIRGKMTVSFRTKQMADAVQCQLYLPKKAGQLVSGDRPIETSVVRVNDYVLEVSGDLNHQDTSSWGYYVEKQIALRLTYGDASEGYVIYS